jgi:hypothetical protein
MSNNSNLAAIAEFFANFWFEPAIPVVEAIAVFSPIQHCELLELSKFPPFLIIVEPNVKYYQWLCRTYFHYLP